MAKMIPLYSLSSNEEIERRAKMLFERGGCPADRDLDHWLQAEADYLEVLRLSPGLVPNFDSRLVKAQLQRRQKRNNKPKQESIKI